jgi:spore coat-associated protein N
MNIKKQLGMALATTALGATLLAGGSLALFSSTAANEGNTFTAGTVVINSLPTGAVFATSTNIGNMAPGDQDNKVLTVTNNGTLDAWVKISDIATSGDLFVGVTPLAVTFDGGAVLIAAGQSHDFNVGYSFPLAAGNEYQGDSGTVTFNVAAVQDRNNTNAAGNGPTAWN